jgi:hypothetical protein
VQLGTVATVPNTFHAEIVGFLSADFADERRFHFHVNNDHGEDEEHEAFFINGCPPESPQGMTLRSHGRKPVV